MFSVFRLKRFFQILFFLSILCFPLFNVSAQEGNSKNFCAVYFTGVGCPHCAQTDPEVLQELPEKYENLTVIEYEIYQTPGNPNLMSKYNENYNTGLGIPLLIFGPND